MKLKNVNDLYENRKPREQWKDRYIYTILGLFGGVFGVHNFYLGKKKIALLQILISFSWILLLSLSKTLMASVLFGLLLTWVIIEIFCVRYDPDGDLMNDEARPLRLLLAGLFLLVFILLPLLFVIYIIF